MTEYGTLLLILLGILLAVFAKNVVAWLNSTPKPIHITIIKALGVAIAVGEPLFL